MCELFGLSASHAVSARATLHGFRRRGGEAADNPDGWGIVWWEAGGFHLVKEPLPGHNSTLFAERCDATRSPLVVAHVRKARHPPINTPGNTHPFLRGCCEREWVFAHNGLVPEIVDLEMANERAVCQPQGETDSEYAFCHVLSHIAQDFHAPAVLDGHWLETLATVSELIARHGKFNFLMSDGDCLLAYGHDRLHYLETRDPAGAADCALVATEPLPAQGSWTPFAPGELRIYRAGRLAGRIATRPPQPAAMPAP